MKIKEEFEFIYEKGKYIEKYLGIKKSNMLEAKKAIHETIVWLENSPFRKMMDSLIIHIEDLPIKGVLAFIGTNEGNDEISIYINVTDLVDDYEKDNYKLDFFFKEKISCAEYTIFIFLHEIGHLVHALLQSVNSKSPKEKMEEYIMKYEQYYEKFENKYLDLQSVQAKRAYRKIPSEKTADSFAWAYWKEIDSLLN